MTSKKTPPLKCSEGTVYISNTKDGHVITVKREKKTRYIDRCEEVSEALKIQKECYEHLKNRTLDEWVRDKRERKRKGNRETPPLKCPEGTVHISNSNNTYTVLVRTGRRLQYIGRYKDASEALENQKECYERLRGGSFDEWRADKCYYDQGFSEKLELFAEYCSKYGDVPSSSQIHPTVYKDVNLSMWWIGQKMQFRAGAMRDWKLKAFHDKGIHLEEYTKEPKTKEVKKSKTKGVCYSKTGRKWQAFIVKEGKLYWLGRSVDYQEMVSLRKEAEKHTEDFLEWYNENKKTMERGKVNKISKMRGVTYNKPSKRWRATYYFEKKMYYLGQYKKMEDAIEMRKEAEKHADDFLKWYQSRKEKTE